MEAFYGTWNEVDCTNSDGLMKSLGACNDVKNKKPLKMEVCQDGDKIGVNIDHYINTNQHFVKLEEEFDENTVDGRVVKATYRMEGNKLVKEQKWDGKETRIVNEIKDGKMVMTFTFEGVTSVYTFEKA